MSNASVIQSPVLVRRGQSSPAAGMAAVAGAAREKGAGRRSYHSRTRRRYDIALNIPGAEIRIPSLPMLNFSWRIASGLLVVMMLASLYFLLYSPVFKVGPVEIFGLKRLTPADVTPMLGLTGEAIVQVDPFTVEQGLRAAFPEFSSVQIRISLPAQVKLFVVERQPVIDWVEQDKEQWVDDKGVAFPPRGSVEGLLRVEADGSPLPASQPDTVAAADAQAASGKQAAVQPSLSAQLLPVELVSTILSMRSYVPEGSVLAYSKDHGLGWNDVSGWRVFFGSRLQDIDQKLIVYAALVERLNNEGIKPTMISVEHLHAPYYRVER